MAFEPKPVTKPLKSPSFEVLHQQKTVWYDSVVVWLKTLFTQVEEPRFASEEATQRISFCHNLP